LFFLLRQLVPQQRLFESDAAIANSGDDRSLASDHPALGVRRRQIVEGHYGDVKLDNLSFVRVGRWEGDLWARKATGIAGLYIDDHADDRQMEALPAIIGGRAGGFPGWVNECFAGGRQSRGIERANITYEIAPDLGQWGVGIVGKIKAWATAISGPTSPREISAANKRTWQRNRARTATRHLWEVDDFIGRRATDVIVGFDRDVLDADMLLMILIGDDRRHVELHAVQVGQWTKDFLGGA